jgi:diacylglycerol O-acyltransferase
MDKLGAFDLIFYKADQYQVTRMVMCGVSILQPAEPGDKLDAQAITDHLAARLQTIPLLRKKFIQDPLRIGSVRKVEDPEFDIRDHIAMTSLPGPGGYQELTHCLAEMSAETLGPEQMWRWTVIDGLEGGKLAVVSRLHHALADGVGIVAALSSMYDEHPVKPEKPSVRFTSYAEEPTPYALLGDAIAESTSRIVVKTPQFLLKNTRPLLAALGNGVKELLANRNNPDSKPPVPEVQGTSLNISETSNRRAISYKTLSLPEVKALAKLLSCKVNDIGLLLYSFAMQHYFDSIGEQIDFDLWCGMPISTRSESSAEGGNQVAVGKVNLHNTIADARERLQAISRDSAEAKSNARPEEPLLELQEVADVVFPAVLDGLLYLIGKFNLMGKSNESFTYANALMSNVPGPPHAVYIGNAVVVENIPMIPILDLIAVSGGFVSTEQLITIGFHCHGDAVKDPELFVQGVELGLKALRKTAAVNPGVRKRSTKPKASVKRKPAHSKQATGKKAAESATAKNTVLKSSPAKTRETERARG